MPNSTLVPAHFYFSSFVGLAADFFFLVQIPLALGYLIFRLFSLFTRIFQPRLNYDPPWHVVFNLLRLFISSLSVYWLSVAYRPVSLIVSPLSQAVYIVLLIVAGLISLLTLGYILRRADRLPPSGFTRPVLRSLSLAIACFIVSAFIFLVRLIS